MLLPNTNIFSNFASEQRETTAIQDQKRDNKTSGLACPRFQYMDDYYQRRFNTNQNFTQHEPSPLQEIENRLLALQPCNSNKSTKTSLTGLTSISAPAIVPCRNRKILALCVFRIQDLIHFHSQKDKRNKFFLNFSTCAFDTCQGKI